MSAKIEDFLGLMTKWAIIVAITAGSIGLGIMATVFMLNQIAGLFQ